MFSEQFRISPTSYAVFHDTNPSCAMKNADLHPRPQVHKCLMYTTNATCTFVDMNFEHFAFAGDFATLTVFASVLGIDAFPLALALRADGLHLLNKARTKLLDTHLDTSPTASRALLYCSCFASTTLTHIVHSTSINMIFTLTNNRQLRHQPTSNTE